MDVKLEDFFTLDIGACKVVKDHDLAKRIYIYTNVTIDVYLVRPEMSNYLR